MKSKSNSTPTRFAEVSTGVHEKIVAEKLLPIFQRMQLLKNTFSKQDREYFEMNASHFEKHGVLPNAGRFAEFCRDRLSKIKTKSTDITVRGKR